MGARAVASGMPGGGEAVGTAPLTVSAAGVTVGTAVPTVGAAPPTVGTAPLTVGTAGHIDHGKTELVRALAGVDTDRLAEEKRRGITIVLGFAPLRLPSGRVVSLVDVPGHERLIRVMVSGASGIDLFLLCIAADDGVMPQTLEHVRVLQGLDISHGVVAITKSDLADPARAAQAAAALVPGAEIVACCARTGAGVPDVAAALDRVAAGVRSRALLERPAVLHVDRVFTIRGAGTVVTGTLWSGQVSVGERLRLLPQGQTVRVRGVQVHDAACERAQAGQRVALNVAGLSRRELAPGDVLASPAAPVASTYRIEAMLALLAPIAAGERVQVHHGTRACAARARRLGGNRWQLRLERPLVAGDGDRLVIRRIAPPDTLGGGVITRVGGVPREGRQTRWARGAASRAGATPEPATRPAGRVAQAAQQGTTDTGQALDPRALALEQRLRRAGHRPPSRAELGADAAHLHALVQAGRAVRIGRDMYAHAEAVALVRARVQAIIASEGSATLARLRDELGTSRKYAQAWLERLDADRVTLRRADDTRVLRAQHACK